MSLDDRIAAYFQLHGQGQDLVDSTGRVYDAACSRCCSVTRHWKPSEEVWVCGHCGERWGYEDVEILKGEVCRRSKQGKPIPAPRPGEYENRLVGLVELGYHLNVMLRADHWRWPTQVLVGHAITSCDYREIAIHATAYGWPNRRGGEWTEAGARQAASRARCELRARLSRVTENSLRKYLKDKANQYAV